jgi:hypothetical protein
VAVAAFLVALCPDALCIGHHDGQLTAILRPIPGTEGVVVPAAAPRCPQDGDQVYLPDTEDCSKYYNCEDERPRHMRCPVNQYFCPQKQRCTVWSETVCKYECICITCPITEPTPETTRQSTTKPTAETTRQSTTKPTPQTTRQSTTKPTPETTRQSTTKPTPETTRQSTTKPTPEPIVCPPIGNPTPTYFPNPDNCNKFYQCSNGVPVPMVCPTVLYFCPQKNVCSWSWDPECIRNCNVVNN